MVNASDLNDRAVHPEQLTDRQREVASLVRSYISVAHEWPSAGWLSRRLNISRQTAYEHLLTVRERMRR